MRSPPRLTGTSCKDNHHYKRAWTVQWLQTTSATTAPSNGVGGSLVGAGIAISEGRAKKGGRLIHLTTWGQLRRDALGQSAIITLGSVNL